MEYPKLLYKYRPFDEYTFDMLENKYIFLCQAKKLDDPLECDTTTKIGDVINEQTKSFNEEFINSIFEYIKPCFPPQKFEKDSLDVKYIFDENNYNIDRTQETLINEFIRNNPDCDENKINEYYNALANDSIQNELKKSIERIIKIAYNAKEKIGICSMSETNNNEGLWEEYTNKNEGCCIEYDISDYEYKDMIFPVIYNDNRQTNIILQFTLMLFSEVINKMPNRILDADNMQLIKLFLTKNTKWSYQKEWRVIGDADKKLKSPHIKSIYLGQKVTQENKKYMIKYKNMNGIKLFQRMNDGRFVQI